MIFLMIITKYATPDTIEGVIGVFYGIAFCELVTVIAGPGQFARDVDVNPEFDPTLPGPGRFLNLSQVTKVCQALLDTKTGQRVVITSEIMFKVAHIAEMVPSSVTLENIQNIQDQVFGVKKPTTKLLYVLGQKLEGSFPLLVYINNVTTLKGKLQNRVEKVFCFWHAR